MTNEEHLNAALIEWVKKSKVSCMVRDKAYLIKFTGRNEIDVDFQQFPEEYVRKFIVPDMDKFCVKFLKSIEKTMFIALAKIEVRDYRFHFTFRYYGKYIGKDVNYYLLSKVA